MKEAEELGVQVLEIRKRVLGEEHPETLTSMNNLALTYYASKSQGYYAKAVALMEECFQMRERVLGPQHPFTVSSLSYLTEWKLENVDIGG